MQSKISMIKSIEKNGYNLIKIIEGGRNFFVWESSHNNNNNSKKIEIDSEPLLACGSLWE